MKTLLILVTLSLAGCQFDIKAESSTKFFRANENGGEVYKSRQAYSDYKQRGGNNVDKALRSFFNTNRGS